MQYPEKLNLAFLPTPIYPLPKLSEKYGKEIYIKRDDLTGVETSGNKIRKLEYSLAEALREGADLVITCGGIQSNHCRATAYAAARLSLKCCLLLRGNEAGEPREGNYFLDKLVGADIVIRDPAVFHGHANELMEAIAETYRAQGYRPYIIPMGASNGIGTFGYIHCMEEILAQEQAMGLNFDTLVDAVGSGGTYAGLYAGAQLLSAEKRIVGFNVCDTAEQFRQEITEILRETAGYLDCAPFDPAGIEIIDGYVGRGYALNRPEELAALTEFARMESVVLDPVYTGKAYFGMIHELEKGTFADSRRILFLHTGGLYGLFPKEDEFGF